MQLSAVLRIAGVPVLVLQQVPPVGHPVHGTGPNRWSLRGARCVSFAGYCRLQVRWRSPQALHDVGQVQRLAVPGRHRFLARDQDAGVLEVLDQLSGGVEPDRWRRWTLFQGPSAAMEEPYGAGLAHPHAEAAFMEQPVVPPAEEHEVRELRFAAVGPVDDVVGVAVLRGATGEAATLVAELQSAPDRGWNRARLAADAQDLTRLVSDPSSRRIARLLARFVRMRSPS